MTNGSYQNRIDRVVDYIQANLESDLSVGQLSEVACFSEFHFSRIFREQMGEPVYQFIRRLRLEKAAELLLSNTSLPVTDVALMCGFATPSSFAKSFKAHFKMNATEWRQRADTSFGGRAFPFEPNHFSIENNSPVWTFEETGRQVKIEEIPSLKVGYVRYVGQYQGDEEIFTCLYKRLFQWALPRGYVADDTVTLNLYHDNPEITESGKLRVMVAVPIPDSVETSDTVGITTLSGGTYATCRFSLKKDGFVAAWKWMFAVWLKESGYELDDRELFERYLCRKIMDGDSIFEVDICVPVKAK